MMLDSYNNLNLHYKLILAPLCTKHAEWCKSKRQILYAKKLMAMKKGGVIYIVIITMLLSACGAITKLHTPPKPLQPTDVGYNGDDEALFYYTEALKRSYTGHKEETTLKLLHKAIEIDSNHVPSLYQLANIYSKSDINKATGYSKRAMEIDSSNLWIKGQLGQLLISAHNYSEATDIYEELIVELPEPNNYRVLAALYHQDNKPFTAITTLESAEKKFGRIEELSAFKSYLLRELRLHDKAIAETKERINSYPYNYKNYLTLAELYAETKKDSLAYVNYEKALSINPNAIEILLSLTKYYKGIGNNNQLLITVKTIFETDKLTVPNMISMYNEMIADKTFYRKNIFQINDLALTLIMKYPNNPDILKLYTSNLIAQGKLDQALTLYKEQTKRDSVPIEYLNAVIDIEAYKKNIDSVEVYSALAISMYPENIDLRLRRAGIFSYLKKFDKARDEYKFALKHTENDSIRSSIEGMLGDIYHELGEPKKTYKQYDKALKLDTNNIVVLNNYAYFLSEDNTELKQALEMAKRVIVLSPGNATYLDTYGWILYKLGDKEQAKKIIQQAISLDSHNSSEILLHYGDVLQSLGDTFMAKIYWKKALEAGHDKIEIDKRVEIQNK